MMLLHLPTGNMLSKLLILRQSYLPHSLNSLQAEKCLLNLLNLLQRNWLCTSSKILLSRMSQRCSLIIDMLSNIAEYMLNSASCILSWKMLSHRHVISCMMSLNSTNFTTSLTSKRRTQSLKRPKPMRSLTRRIKVKTSKKTMNHWSRKLKRSTNQRL